MTLYWNVIFHFGQIEPSIKLKKIIRNQDRLGTSESYNPTNPERSQKSLKDPNRFGLVGP